MDAFGGLEMIRARYKDFSFSPHTHDEFMVAVTEKGNGQPQIQGKSRSIHPDDMILLNPGEVHGGGPGRDSIWHYRGFYPSVRLMQLAANEESQSTLSIPKFSKSVITDPYMAALLRNVHRILEEPQSTLKSESLLLSALTNLLKRYGAGKQADQPVRRERQSVKRAKEYLEALPGKNITLEELAREAALSPFYFCRVFHRETGLSPHSYQLLVRVQFAKNLLQEGIPIARAAAEAGFFDQAHFTKHFKRVYGVSPSYFFP